MKTLKSSIITISSLLLFACNSYRVEVDITPEREAELKQEIIDFKEALSAYDDSDGSIDLVSTVGLARAYEELGELGKAIKVYEDVLEDGRRSRAVIHNLGRLYEDVGEYNLAIEQYQRIIDEYYENSYLYDITWAYIRAGDRKMAEKFFNAWQLEFKTTDGQIQDAIKKLREAEGL
ncbi:MAG: tetratricopeptide repeat protein [Candidatus Peregrinibacteria bacterium]|nr:tetratricopeptide repeat protein [Candidatus Peregrinibacteria bacterium]